MTQNQLSDSAITGGILPEIAEQIEKEKERKAALTDDCYSKINCYDYYRKSRSEDPNLSTNDFVNKHYLCIAPSGQLIPLDAYVKTIFGKRIMFHCPWCSRRCENLFQLTPRMSFACINCHNLTYYSRQISRDSPRLKYAWHLARIYLTQKDKKAIAKQKNQYKYLHAKVKKRQARRLFIDKLIKECT